MTRRFLTTAALVLLAVSALAEQLDVAKILAKQKAGATARRRAGGLLAGAFWSDFIVVCTFVSWRRSMIVEVRTYKLKPGQRDRFIEFFKGHTWVTPSFFTPQVQAAHN